MMDPNEAITIVTTTCAIPSCPRTTIINQVYGSARRYLPTARWLFLFDGVHPIQKHMRPGYEKYKDTLISRMEAGTWNNSRYMVFRKWHHQGGMIRKALQNGLVATPLVFWLEHDFPLNGLPIDFQGITNSLLANECCYIRFLLEEETWIKLQAKNMPSFSSFGVPLMRTIHYSSLPHVCRRELLERLVKEFVTGRDHLECVQTEGIAHQEPEWKLALYTPSGQLDRFSSIDGRAGHPKPAVEL